jgi:hypothetical protein
VPNEEVLFGPKDIEDAYKELAEARERLYVVTQEAKTMKEDVYLTAYAHDFANEFAPLKSAKSNEARDLAIATLLSSNLEWASLCTRLEKAEIRLLTAKVRVEKITTLIRYIEAVGGSESVSYEV